MNARRRTHGRATKRGMLGRAARGSLIATMAVGSVSVTAGAAPDGPVPVAGASSALSQGAQGSSVKALQQALINAGIPVAGGADGVFGPATKGAIIAFQQARGLAITGSVDQATADALGITLSTASTGVTNTSGSTSGGLQEGSQGEAVKELQRKLLDFGVYLATGANGTWGSSTTRGLRQFQRWNGLTVTGTLNTATTNRLGLGTTTTSTTTTTTTTTSPSSNPYVGLKQGSSGTLVKDLQQALQATGLVVRGGADGQFGPGTANALRAFQGFNGLTKNGVVSQRAAELLKLGTGAATPPPAVASPYLGLKVGSTGPRVRDVQQALMAAGVSVRGGADGAFGLVTKAALTSYQKATGITADGTVNQATITKLGLGSSSGPAPFAPSSQTNSTTTTSSNPYVGLKVGSIGPLVKELQQALQSTGLVIRGGADGVFGTSTATSLKFFQRVNGINQTGVVTERGANLLALGTGTVQGTSNPNSGGSIKLDHFPVQGQCAFGDTWGAPRGGGRKHVGVDIIAAEGKLLYAVVDGEISKLYWDQPGALAGNGLRIEQPNGTYFTYLHLLSFAPGIKVGTQVKAGDVIGFVGNTGSSATPHLHLEIHPNGGAAINPYPYVRAIDDCNNTTPQYQGTFT